ncbi:MAG TPA: MG2 domain-containing protein, partial [Bacteroidia bacterium]
VEFTNGNDQLISDNGIYLYKYYKEEKKKYPHTYYFTDRAIYRPGQTVFFKGIMLESDGETNNILPNRTETVYLYDVNYQQVANLKLTTNEFGSFNGSFALPQNLMNGQMRIADSYGNVYFSVEDYKRPKFEVTFPPIKGVYKLNENVEVKGKAQSYAGANIEGAEVKYRVVRNATFPYFWCWWRGYYPSSAQMEITNGITTTNDTGGFVINFKAMPDLSISKKYSPLYTYTIYSDVTDIAGETHSSQTYVSVGYNAMKLEVNIPSELNRDSAQEIKISSTNLNGEFEPAKVKVQIWKQNEPAHLFRKRLWEQADKHLMTKEEYYASFPNDVYADEDNQYKWEKGVEFFTGEFETEKTKKFGISTLHQWSPGAYVMEATTKDKFGEEVKDVKYFTVYSSGGTIVPVNDYDWFTALNSTGEPGTKASFLIGSKEKEVKVLYEIEHKNVIVKKEWITLNSEQKRIEILIEEKHRGNFGYHLLFVKNGRAYSHDGTITVPYTNKELDLQFETFRDKLIPGQKEEWKLKIKNKKGDKIAAEMLAAMYDASLDAFRPNNWYFNVYNSYYSARSWEIYPVAKNNVSQLFYKDWNVYASLLYKYYDKLNWFGYYNYYGYGHYYYKGDYAEGDGDGVFDSAAPMEMEEKAVVSKVAQSAPVTASETTVSRNASYGFLGGAKKESAKNKDSAGEDIPDGS